MKLADWFLPKNPSMNGQKVGSGLHVLAIHPPRDGSSIPSPYSRLEEETIKRRTRDPETLGA